MCLFWCKYQSFCNGTIKSTQRSLWKSETGRHWKGAASGRNVISVGTLSDQKNPGMFAWHLPTTRFLLTQPRWFVYVCVLHWIGHGWPHRSTHLWSMETIGNTIIVHNCSPSHRGVSIKCDILNPRKHVDVSNALHFCWAYHWIHANLESSCLVAGLQLC